MTINLYTIGQWLGYGTIALAGLTLLGFVLQWGIRFRLVGITSFMAVLTGGVFSLYLGLFTQTSVPGSVRYVVTYDTGATQVVIAVPPTIAASEVEATLRQAASNLFSPGRLGRGETQLNIRMRTILHPEPGVSQLVYLGEVTRSLSTRDDAQMDLKVYSKQLDLLPQPKA